MNGNGKGKVSLDWKDWGRVLGIVLTALIVSHGISAMWGSRGTRIAALEADRISEKELRTLVREEVKLIVAPVSVKIDRHIQLCDKRFEKIEAMYEQWLLEGYRKARGEDDRRMKGD